MNNVEPATHSSLVTVLVPTFNDGNMLDAALLSLKDQTHQDLEVIISNDGGTDGSVDRLSEEYAVDPRFHFVHRPKNLGMTGNWNATLSIATGEWVMKLDADDALERDTVFLLLDACQRRGSEIAFCRTGYCDESLNSIGPYKGDEWMRDNGLDPEREIVLGGFSWYQWCFDDRQLWHSNAFMVKRALLQATGGWDERWGCASDSDLVLRLLETGGLVVHVPYVGVQYRLRQGSVSDNYRRNSWLSREVAAIHLLSLERQLQLRTQLSWRLRRNWYRYWCIWKDTARSGEREGEKLPVVFGLTLAPPPPSVRLIGALYERISRLKRKGMARFGRRIQKGSSA